MSNLLIFFALPLATIIIAVVLERVWKNYILVTLFAFAVYLIVAFALGDTNLLVLVIIYTFLAFIAAFLSMLFRKLSKKLERLEAVGGANDNDEDERRHCRRRPTEVGGVNDTNNGDNSNNCNCNRNNTQNLAINATVTPNQCNNGRTGNFRGQYRRRF